MHGIRTISDSEQSPTWERVQERLLALKHEKTLTLDVDDDTFLIVLFTEPVGYLVSGCGVGDKDWHTLIDRSLGDDIVTAFDGGDTRSFPRYVFVDAPLLLKAMETYYRTGERDRTCEWVETDQTFYD
ncbi:Imm1 family immunity protein [Limnoglobus roseus]|uniref:Uncharacterized protein n=1 Tax=Limnoglobus roseus TaxID=2598579 RepID=A0A5C1ACI9_9BACT|nr:Imm1 family immunity protein [Limnoglobus roseus]QEL16460.1 hypothetical protein PX52LOC_03414 [Limnoglobus roseus]